jgi:hypothetical protein
MTMAVSHACTHLAMSRTRTCPDSRPTESSPQGVLEYDDIPVRNHLVRTKECEPSFGGFALPSGTFVAINYVLAQC